MVTLQALSRTVRVVPHHDVAVDAELRVLRRHLFVSRDAPAHCAHQPQFDGALGVR